MRIKVFPVELIDGGDLGCGELLLEVHRRIRDLPAGAVVAITTTDPAAVIDIPAWCHLTGHRYQGSETTAGGVAHMVELARTQKPAPRHHPTVSETSP